MTDRELPGHARVVIVGGGIMGVALAYHLALSPTSWTSSSNLGTTCR